jgi:hypothetical protein
VWTPPASTAARSPRLALPWRRRCRVHHVAVESSFCVSQFPHSATLFTWSSISASIADPYLAPGELIAGVIHGADERCFYTCPCHYADVVYTTRHRLVCMSCGATHVVLREPVLTTFQQTISPEEWDNLFSRHHEPLDLAIIDVQDIENGAPFVWSTN